MRLYDAMKLNGLFEAFEDRAVIELDICSSNVKMVIVHPVVFNC